LASRDFTGKRCLATGEIGALAYSEFIAVVQGRWHRFLDAMVDFAFLQSAIYFLFFVILFNVVV